MMRKPASIWICCLLVLWVFLFSVNNCKKDDKYFPSPVLTKVAFKSDSIKGKNDIPKHLVQDTSIVGKKSAKDQISKWGHYPKSNGVDLIN
jgi:hypothetical protein